MPNHACETYDFPVMAGAFAYSFTKKILKKLGGTWQLAVQDAIDEARDKARGAGEAAMVGETCAAPCECFIYVDVSLDRITPAWVPGKVGKQIVIPVSGTWKTGVLCVKPKAASGGGGGKESGAGAGDKKKKKKSKKK
jgi:hypothetical protein